MHVRSYLNISKDQFKINSTNLPLSIVHNQLLLFIKLCFQGLDFVLIQILIKMRKYQLQYKMKKWSNNNRKNLVLTPRQPQLPDIDDFIESADTFYQQHHRKNSNKECTFHKPINPQIRRGVDDSRSRIAESHENLRKSIEKDRSSHLDNWRKEAFKFQQKSFSLEQEVSKLKLENSSLKNELKYMNELKINQKKMKQDQSSAHIIQNMELENMIQKQKLVISSLSKELKEKGEEVQKLEQRLDRLQNTEKSIKKEYILEGKRSQLNQEDIQPTLPKESSKNKGLNDSEMGHILQNIDVKQQRIHFKNSQNSFNQIIDPEQLSI